jgi:hypothetical protein
MAVGKVAVVRKDEFLIDTDYTYKAETFEIRWSVNTDLTEHSWPIWTRTTGPQIDMAPSRHDEL